MFSPTEKEETHSNPKHLNLIMYVLATIGKSTLNVVVVIAYNCASNRSLSRLMGIRLVSWDVPVSVTT